MAHDLLGAEFDIHGGGNDLQFPHHENEIAQSCCAGHGFAKVWLHNEMLQVEGKKMSKSLGNFFTVKDLLDQGVSGEVIRFVMLSTHYRKPMDWTEKKRADAAKTLAKWRGLAADGGQVSAAVIEALGDDLNTAGAIAELHRLASAGKGAALKASAQFLGLLEVDEADEAVDFSALEARLVELRAQAMETLDFGAVDALKTRLLAAGIQVQMSKADVSLSAPTGFDAAMLEELL
jgi:cysteinyl-tRNA synthetase